MRPLLALSLLVASFPLGCGAAQEAAAAPLSLRGPVQLVVDATHAPQKILRAHLSMPVSPGPLTLLYPKWIPGEHAPWGPIVNLAGLRFAVAGKTIEWRRDSADMYAIHVDVPSGADALEIDLEYLGVSGGPSTAGAPSTLQLLDLSWNHVVLYPKGPSPAQLTYVARVALPPGWKYATALPVAGEQGGVVELKPASLVTLIDSPLVAGAHHRAIPLGDVGGAPHELDVFADSDEALAAPAQRVAAYKHLVVEANALFGARHYDAYRFLYTLSEQIESNGLEHHASSDNRSGERTLIDEDPRRLDADLLPHELVHSWNGKYRRPKGLVTRDYQEPQRTELLWIYEGLTNYLGWVLAARSGLESEEEARDDLAWSASSMENVPGRRWRPLADTAVAAQTLFRSPRAFRTARRGTDYYLEGTLLWLEADVAIRSQTQGQRSLDDFCRAFFGGKDTGPEVSPYELDDVLRGLNAVAPRDWRAFFAARVDRIAEHAPLEGITAGGWELARDTEPNLMMASWESVAKVRELTGSLGVLLGEGAAVLDVIPGSPADKAGLVPGAKLVAVDGRRYSTDILNDALARARSSPAPIELLYETGDFFRTTRLDWHGGLVSPHLKRAAARPDLLSKILAPRRPRPAEASPPSAKKP